MKRSWILSVLFLGLFSGMVEAYPWPMRSGGNFSNPHHIASVLGDYRRSPDKDPRFHNGIDIPAGFGTVVYAIVKGSGMVDDYVNAGTSFESMRVGQFWYVHIRDGIQKGDPVPTGILDNPANPTQICEIRDIKVNGVSGTIAGDHLHLKVIENVNGTGRILNPLTYTLPGTNEGGPTGWSDTLSPIVGYGGTSLTLYRAGNEFTVPPPAPLGRTLFGAVDVLTRSRDTLNSGGVADTTGLYRMAWLVLDPNGTTLSGPHESFRFDQINPPTEESTQTVGLIYSTHVSRHASSATFHYWATNAITLVNNVLTVQDRSWNTNLRKGQPWNGVSASSNFTAQTPDGQTVLAVQAFDFAGNGGTLSTQQGAQKVTLTVDNWWPYVQEAEVTQGAWKKSRAWGNLVGVAEGSSVQFLTPTYSSKEGPTKGKIVRTGGQGRPFGVLNHTICAFGHCYLMDCMPALCARNEEEMK